MISIPSSTTTSKDRGAHDTDSIMARFTSKRGEMSEMEMRRDEMRREGKGETRERAMGTSVQQAELSRRTR